MPEKVVEIPGVGTVRFPDTMSDQEIANVAGKYHAAAKERGDTNVVGVNYDWIADQASKLPRSLQYPAAYAGALMGHLVETFSDPATLASLGATAGAGRLPSAPAGAGPRPSLPTGVVPAVKAAASELASDIPVVRKFSPAVRAARQAYDRAQLPAAAPRAAPSVTIESPLDLAARLPKTAPISPKRVEQSIGSTLGKMNAEEVSAGMKWQAEGVPDAEIVQRLQDARAFKERFGTPSTADVKAEFQRQADSGKKSLVPKYGSKIGRFDVIEEEE